MIDSSRSSRPLIAVTMGDPAGVGPELCLRALVEPSVLACCIPLIFGDVEILRQAARRLGLAPPARVLSEQEWKAQPVCREPAVLHLPTLPLSSFSPRKISAETGRAAFHYLDRAIDSSLAGQIDAITTAPLSKEALHLAGVHFPGHTEILASRTGATRSCMMQYSEEITCTFVTTHVGYREVPALLTVERVGEVIDLTAEALRRLRGRAPRLLLCGLNPHAGEHGLFGEREEERILIPALQAAQARGIDITGPIPADTAFIPARRRTTDAFVCLYHDQGHIPLKALVFDSAVNTTLGLPIIRTSVDHGTALDIAWEGKADPGSLFAALRLAAQLTAPWSPATV